MAKRKLSIPSRTKKLIFQEAGSQCAFCDEHDVSALEIHHIIPIEKGGTDYPENLILVCSTCHSKISQYIISPADVDTKKREFLYGSPRQKKNLQAVNSISIDGNVSGGIIANNLRILGKSSTRMNYPIGSIGANLQMKNYVDHLIKRYYDYRKADSGYGAYKHSNKFHHAEIHKSIQSRFKAKTFFVPETRFEEVCSYLKERIDKTILGRTQRSRGISNYSSFDDYVLEHA